MLGLPGGGGGGGGGGEGHNHFLDSFSSTDNLSRSGTLPILKHLGSKALPIVRVRQRNYLGYPDTG